MVDNISSDILTGINPVEVLNMQHDTEARYADLFKPIDTTPPDITMPKLPDFHAGTVDPDKNINIDKSTPGYQLQDMIRLQQAESVKYPDSAKIPANITLPQSATNRYIDEDFGYKLDRDNEDFYAHQQGAFKEIMKALFVKLPAYTFTKLGTGVGYLLGLANPLNYGDNWVAKAGDNVVAKAFSDLEDNLKNDWLTTYRYTVDQNKGFFQRAGSDLSFWTEDVTDGAAFLASAFVPGLLVSKLGLGVKLAEGLQLTNAEGKVSSFLNGMSKFSAKYGDKLLTTAVNTASESMFEAKGVRDKVFADLMATGKYTEDQANNISAEKAKNSFLWNIAALSFSNLWETNLFYKAINRGEKGIAKAAGTSLLEDYATERVGKFAKLGSYAKTAGEGVLVEGLYEENIQLAIQRKNEGRNTYGGYFTVLNQMLGQTRDAFKGTDKEAAENIGMGGLIGLIFGTGTAIAGKEYTKDRLASERLVEALNKAKNNWLKAQDIYTTDENGNLKEDKAKVAAIFMTQKKTADDLVDAENEVHPVLKNLYKKDVFASFVAAHINQGSFDMLMKQLDDIKTFKPEDLIKLGFDPKGDVAAQLNEYKNYAQKVAKVKKSIDDKVPEITIADIGRKNDLFSLGARQVALEEELSKVDSNISTFRNDIGNSSITDNLVDDLNNKLVRINTQKKVLDKALEEDKPDHQKKLDKYQKIYDDTVKANEEDLNKLKKDRHGFYFYENDRKNKHPLLADLAQELYFRGEIENSIDDTMDVYNDILTNRKDYNKRHEESMQKLQEDIKQNAEKIKKAQEEKKAVKTDVSTPVEEVKTEPVKTGTVTKEDEEALKNLGYSEDDLFLLKLNSKQAFEILESKKRKSTSEEQEAKYEEIKAKIPKKKNVDKNILAKLSEEITNAAIKGEINEQHDTELTGYVNVKNPIGTAMDTEEDHKLDDEDKVVVVEKAEDVKENGFNPATNDVEDIVFEESIWSALAFNSFLKTVTQEEVEENGTYTGVLDEDPYKVFKQGFQRYRIQDESAQNYYRGKIIKDRHDLPRDKNSALQTELGEVLIITDLDGNVVYFDKDYIPSLQKSEGFQEIVYSFNKQKWDDSDVRAHLGSLRTGKSFEEFKEQYEREEKEIELARQLAQKGLEVPIVFTGFSAGMIRQGSKPIDSKIVLADQQLKSIYIAKSDEVYDPENPDKNRVIPNINGQNLINGAAYMVTQRSENDPSVYTRIVPNRIGDNPELFEDVKSLFLHQYEDENQAEIIKKYLKKLLFLGYTKRPTIVVNLNGDNGKYELNILVDGKTMSKNALEGETPVSYIAKQNLNINEKNLGSRYDYFFIKDNKLKVEEKENYNNFILENSKTRSRNILTKEGRVLMNINTYMTFGFLDNAETMQRMLEDKETAPTKETDEIVGTELSPLDGLPELIDKAHKIKLKQADKFQLNQDPLTFFTYLHDQAIKQGNLAAMDKPDVYGKEFMDEILNFFKTPRDNSSLTKDPLKPQRRARIQDAKDNADDAADESKSTTDDLYSGELEARVTDEENQRLFLTEGEITAVNKMFGRAVARRIYGIINSSSYATWMPSGIKLFENAVEGSGYHEAWHEFSQMYLTIAQKKVLYNEVRTRAIDFKTRDGRKLNSAYAIDFDIEEFMADDFRDYVLSNGKSRIINGTNRNTIFRKIVDFLRRLFFGGVNINKLYNELRTGNLNKYTRSVNNAMFGKLNAIILDDLGNEIFDNKKAAYYRTVFDGLLGEQLDERDLDPQDLRNNPALTKNIYDNIFNVINKKHLDPLFDARDAGLPYNEELLDDLYKLTDNNNWNKFINYHKKYSKLETGIEYEIETSVSDYNRNEDELGDENYIITQADEQDDDDLITQSPDEEDDDLTNSANFGGNKLFDLTGNEESSSNAASMQTKSLVRMLKKAEYKDGKNVILYDNNGFARLNDFSHTWNNLAAALADLSTYREMYEKLQDPLVQIKIPEVVQLLTKLPHPDAPVKYQQLSRVLAFRRDFNRSQVDIYSGKMTEDNDFFFLEETKRNTDQIQKEWTANFLALDPQHELFTSGVVLQDEEGRNYINPNITIAYDLKNLEQRELFLNLIGFKFSDETLRDPVLRETIIGFLQGLQDNLNQRLELGQIISNPVYDLKQDIRNDEREVVLKGYGGRINAIINIEGKYSSLNPSMSYQNAEGNTIYALMLNNFLTKTAGLINNVKSLDELIAKREAQFLNKDNNPNVVHSLFLNKIFNKDGSKNNIKLVVGNYSGLKVVTAKGTKAYSTTNLNLRDKIIMDLNSLLKSGKVEIMRTESSKTAYFIGLNTYGRENGYLPAKIDDFALGFNSPTFINTMKGYLIDELVRMKNADSITLENYPKEVAKQFNLFIDILRPINKETGKPSENLKNKIKEDLKLTSAEEVVNMNAEEIEQGIIEFFNGEYKSFIDLLIEEGINKNDLAISLTKKYDQRQLYRAFIANDFLLNVEYTKIFDGDTVFQAHYKDYHKRAKGAISTGHDPMIDDVFVRFMQGIQHNTIAGFLNAVAQNDYKTTKSLVLADDKRDSIYITHNIIQDNLRRLYPNITEEEIKEITGKYERMTLGDGQGHITLDFYRQFLLSINNWSNKQEVMYQKELRQFRLDNSNLNEEYTEEQKKKDRNFIKKYKDVITSFPPIKMQYNGPIEATGTYPQVMDKFSVAPIIPSVYRGTPLEVLHLEMIKKGIGYSKFESGTKKFKSTPHKFYTENGVDTNIGNYNSPVHFLQFLKEQINTKSEIEEDKESIFGSQVRKLIMANVFSNGKAADKWLDIKNRYKTIIRNIREFEKEKLYNELGLSETNGKVNVVDLQRFIKNIQKQAEFRDLNDNIKDYIQYDKDNKAFKYPLEASLNKKAIQGMLMGIIDTRLRKQKVSGDMLIQVSSSGFENNDFKYKNASKEDSLKYGTNGLKFYDLYTDKNGVIKTRGIQVKVSINGFKNLLNKIHPDGESIETIDRLNALLKDEDWIENNKSLISLVGYRIPTQGSNSIEYMEVAEFLPEIAGNIVIPPAEIVAKSGSDFDIDKMSVFRPAFDRFGNLVSDQSIKDLEQLLSDIINTKKVDVLKEKYKISGNIEALSDVLNQEEDFELDPETVKLKKEIGRLRNSRKQIYSNELIKLYGEILSDSDMYRQLITPNDTNLIKNDVIEIARKIGKLSNRDFKTNKETGEETKAAYFGTQIFRYKNNLRKFDSLLSAKKLLGVFAVNNSFSQLLQQGDVWLNMKYNTKQSFRNVSRDVKLLLFSPAERESIIENGRINISTKYNVYGELKQDYFSQFINGTVDAASDDFLGYSNISFENIGVLCYLIHQGLPAKRAEWFLNQPVMLKYYSELKKSKEYKSNIQGKILGDLLGENYFYIDEGGNTKFSADNFNKGINNLLQGNTTRLIDGKNQQVKRVPDSFYFSETMLKDAARRLNEVDKYLEDPKAKITQAAIFAHFITLQEQAQLFRNYQSVFNMDTTKMQNPMDAYRLRFKTQQIVANGLFNEKDIKELESGSIISTFINNKSLVLDIASQLMPYAFNSRFTAASAHFVENNIYANKSKISRIMSTLENDWVEYIIKSFGVINKIPLTSYTNNLLVGKNALAKRLVGMRRKYPELLKEYSLFDKLRTNISSFKGVNQQNIEVQKLFEDTSDDQNRYITEFRQLINFSNTKYTIEQQTEIRKFFSDLAILGFLQSGFNRSPISFQELIPYEQMTDMFDSALKIFKEKVADPYVTNKEGDKLKPILKDFVSTFLSQFVSINPTLVSTKAKSKQSWRGKQYRLTEDLYTQIQTNYLKEQAKNQIKELESQQFSLLNPEIDINNNIILNSNNINNINTGKQSIVSLTDRIDDGERVIKNKENNKQSLVHFKRQGQYRYEIEDGLIYKIEDNGKKTKGYDKDIIAKTLGFKSFEDLRHDPHMLAFGAGLQTRNIYRVTPIINEVVAPKENLNDEIEENILPSEEKVVSLDMRQGNLFTPLSKIDFQQDTSTGYTNRTTKNASADATIAFAIDFNSAGEKATKKSVDAQGKQYIEFNIDRFPEAPQEGKQRVANSIVKQLNQVGAKTLNIAGNGIYTMKGKYSQKQLDEFVYEMLKLVVESPDLENKIESVRTGGQTGADEAGAKAAQRLGIPTTILAPKGWKFRNEEGKDISNEKAFKARFEDFNKEETDDFIKKMVPKEEPGLLEDSPFASDESIISKGLKVISSTDSTPEELKEIEQKIKDCLK